MKVFNKGIKPLIYSRTFDGPQVIHPNKHLVFGDDEGKKLIGKFENAVSEKDFKDIQEDKKKAEEKKGKK